MADLNARDAKLVQWLNEAHAKKLGGSATAGPNIPGVPEAVGEAAGKAVAAVKGQVGMARAAATEQAETHLRNAQEELREEHVEIALYTRLETLATEVGDRETAQLAKGIRRDEERMAKFLDAELKRLVKAVVRADIPSDQRANDGRRRTRSRSATPKKTAARQSSNGRARLGPAVAQHIASGHAELSRARYGAEPTVLSMCEGGRTANRSLYPRAARGQPDGLSRAKSGSPPGGADGRRSRSSAS